MTDGQYRCLRLLLISQFLCQINEPNSKSTRSSTEKVIPLTEVQEERPASMRILAFRAWHLSSQSSRPSRVNWKDLKKHRGLQVQRAQAVSQRLCLLPRCLSMRDIDTVLIEADVSSMGRNWLGVQNRPYLRVNLRYAVKGDPSDRRFP